MLKSILDYPKKKKRWKNFTEKVNSFASSLSEEEIIWLQDKIRTEGLEIGLDISFDKKRLDK